MPLIFISTILTYFLSCLNYIHVFDFVTNLMFAYRCRRGLQLLANSRIGKGLSLTYFVLMLPVEQKARKANILLLKESKVVKRISPTLVTCLLFSRVGYAS